MTTNYSWWGKTENLTAVTYLRAHREDWTANVRKFAPHVDGGKTILDIGVGDGHTAAQLYGRVTKPKRVDLVEVDAKGLKTAQQRLQNLNIPLGDLRAQGIREYLAQTTKTWDRVVAVHSNYYFGDNAQDDAAILRQLIDRLNPGGAIVMMTALGTGAYYTVSSRNLFHANVTAESVAERGKKLGLDVTFEQLSGRWYVGDVSDSPADQQEVHAFFTESREEPSKQNLAKLLKRIEREQEGDWINFKDANVVLQKQ